jgi:hypothetical protein
MLKPERADDDQPLVIIKIMAWTGLASWLRSVIEWQARGIAIVPVLGGRGRAYVHGRRQAGHWPRPSRVAIPREPNARAWGLGALRPAIPMPGRPCGLLYSPSPQPRLSPGGCWTSPPPNTDRRLRSGSNQSSWRSTRLADPRAPGPGRSMRKFSVATPEQSRARRIPNRPCHLAIREAACQSERAHHQPAKSRPLPQSRIALSRGREIPGRERHWAGRPRRGCCHGLRGDDRELF